jgi:hypothetical protein
MTTSIVQLVDGLPQDNITVKVLKALDFVTPIQWNNLVNFDEMIRQVTGETDPKIISKIKDRSIILYTDSNKGYQSAIKLYQIVDKADTAMATAALANKVGEKIGLLSFLNKITPKADLIQTVDLLLKVTVEIIAFCKIKGLPSPNPQVFVESLTNNYTDAALMRMVALVCLDALLPLGPDFLTKIHGIIDQGDSSLMQENPVFASISNNIPGDTPSAKFGFITQSFNAVQNWMNGLVSKAGLTPTIIFNQLGKFIQVADDNLDFVAAFIDQTTNYYEHTGIQTVARNVILEAHSLVKQELANTPVATSKTSETSGTSDYNVDDKVEVLYDGYWYPCKIKKIKGNTYLVRYLCDNDPDDDEWVTGKKIRPQQQYQKGSSVEVYDEDEEEWYEATVEEIKDNSYFVSYDDYDESDWVSWKILRFEE